MPGENENFINRFTWKFKDDENFQEVVLELFENKTFKLMNHNSGFWGTNENSYSGKFSLEENNLMLQIDTAHNYRYTAVDDEPSEGSWAYPFVIETEVIAGSISFIFPESRGEWKVELSKNN